MKGPSGQTWKVACLLNAQGRKLLLRILLDNQSTTDSFGDKGLLSNIQEVNDSMTAIANGGELTTNVKGHLAGHGDAWCHLDAMTNILSLSNVMKKHQVGFDRTKDGAFCVCKPDHIAKFQCSNKELFYHDTQECDLTLLNAADKNKAGLSERQLARAKKACNYQGIVAHATQVSKTANKWLVAKKSRTVLLQRQTSRQHKRSVDQT